MNVKTYCCCHCLTDNFEQSSLYVCRGVPLRYTDLCENRSAIIKHSTKGTINKEQYHFCHIPSYFHAGASFRGLGEAPQAPESFEIRGIFLRYFPVNDNDYHKFAEKRYDDLKTSDRK